MKSKLTFGVGGPGLCKEICTALHESCKESCRKKQAEFAPGCKKVAEKVAAPGAPRPRTPDSRPDRPGAAAADGTTPATRSADRGQTDPERGSI
jgi:hypothetical protein